MLDILCKYNSIQFNNLLFQSKHLQLRNKNVEQSASIFVLGRYVCKLIPNDCFSVWPLKSYDMKSIHFPDLPIFVVPLFHCSVQSDKVIKRAIPRLTFSVAFLNCPLQCNIPQKAVVFHQKLPFSENNKNKTFICTGISQQ